MKKFIILGIILFTQIASFVTAGNQVKQWSITKANNWYKETGWLVGANFVPSTAINQLEMWQADTFDPETIERELAWAEELGFNTMRVFLHHLLWQDDSQGFIQRIEKYLEIADKHGIRTMLVLLDDVWHPYPKLGKQSDPKPHVHNSGWVQSPGYEVLIDPKKCDALEGYVKGIITHFKDDKRVVIWDLYNEPGNTNGSSYGKMEPKNKSAYSLDLMKKVFKWAREVYPSQPLCVDVWTIGAKDLSKMSAIDRYAYEHSDVINFHSYSNDRETEKMVQNLAASERPLICTEYMARATGSTFKDILPIFKKYNVSGYNWGFVAGKSQTIYPWDSWSKNYTNEPELWFHDIFRVTGEPYNKTEVELIKSYCLPDDKK